MAFTVTGKLGNRDVKIKWDDGKLTGDAFTIDFLNVNNNQVEPTNGPPPMSFVGDRLKGPLSAFWFIKRHLTEITSVDGDIPYPEVLPDEVIA